MPRTEKQHTGARGENIAVQHLVKRGYRIVARNFRKPWGELDIIAEKRGTLIFVEVKALTSGTFADRIFRPEDHFTRQKMRKVLRTCRLYVQALRRDVPWRLDLIAIEFASDGSLAELRHIEGIEASDLLCALSA